MPAATGKKRRTAATARGVNKLDVIALVILIALIYWLAPRQMPVTPCPPGQGFRCDYLPSGYAQPRAPISLDIPRAR